MITRDKQPCKSYLNINNKQSKSTIMDIMIRPQLVLAISFLYNMSYDEALEFVLPKTGDFYKQK